MSKVYGGLVSSPYNKLDTISHFSVTHTFDGKTIDGGVEEPATIILTTFPESIGAVSGDGIFLKGSSVTVVATPDLESEYPVFIGWYNGDTKVSSNSSYTFTVNSTSTLVAKFEEVKYDITLQKDPTSTGTVTGGGRFVVGASVTVVATPDSESEYPEFDGWYENDTKVSENASYTFTVSGARTLVAKFKEATPTIEYVDLGLPSGLLWASWNIGAESEEEDGAYFSWGNIEPHFPNGTTFSYNWGPNNTGPYASTPGASIPFTSQTKNADYSADSGYDAARELLGGSWRMPTATEFKELYDNTDNEWTAINGVNGRKFMKKSDHSVYVFFPAAGYGRSTSLGNRGSNGLYWSSSLRSADDGYYLNFYSSSVSPQNSIYRYYGYSVRAVQ